MFHLDPSLLTVLGIGAGGGLIAGCWSQIKAVFARITGLLIVRVTVGYNMTEPIQTLCWNEFKRWRSSFPYYDSASWFVQPKDRYERVCYEEVHKKQVLFWDGWKPILVGQSPDKDDDLLQLTFLRGMFSPDKLISRAMRAYNSALSTEVGGRFAVHRFQGAGRKGAISVKMGKGKKGDDDEDGRPAAAPKMRDSGHRHVRLLDYDREQIGQPFEGAQAIQRLALSPEVTEAIEEARRWSKSGQWYRDRQIPWRRGWLLYGPPGTGKSSLSAAIAQEFGLPIYSFDVGSMSNKEFTEYWKIAISNTPAVVLIEDIDAVFHGRENILGEMGGGLTFDALLNTISGVENADGVFLIVTTNHLEHIDSALGLPGAGEGAMSTRPGRLDRALKLASPDEEGRRKIAKRILGEHAKPELTEKLVADGHADTGAQFQERCSSIALKLYWSSNH